MANQKTEKFTEDWVSSYVEALENLHGPLIEDLSPGVEEMNEVLIKNFMEEPQEADQVLSRWINLYLAMLDLFHGILDVAPSIESINQEWIECFLDNPHPVVDLMTSSWVNAYLDLEEMLQANKELGTIHPIEAVNQEWINCFYIPIREEENEYQDGWARAYLACNEDLHGAIEWQPNLNIDDVNAEWIRLFMDEGPVKKSLAKVA